MRTFTLTLFTFLFYLTSNGQWTGQKIPYLPECYARFWCPTASGDAFQLDQVDHGLWTQQGQWTMLRVTPLGDWKLEPLSNMVHYVLTTKDGEIATKWVSIRGVMRLRLVWIANNGTWELIPLGEHAGNDFHPVYDEQRKILFFVSDRAGGTGGSDLYRSHRINGTWTEPIALPKGVNTEFDEDFPSCYKGDLFFSAKNEQGDFDLFKSPLKDQWSLRLQLESPLNTDKNDFQIVFWNDAEVGISTNRGDDSKGSEIWRFEKSVDKQTICMVMDQSGSLQSDEGGQWKTIYTAAADQDYCLDVERGKRVKFRLVDAKGVTLPQVHIKVSMKGIGVVSSMISDERGEWSWEYLPFDFSQVQLWKVEDVSGLFTSPTGESDNNMDLIEARLDLFFENNVSELSTFHRQELDSLIQLCKGQSTSKWVICGYADSKGNQDWNDRLAWNRALAAQSWLLQAGLPPEQLEVRAMGRKSRRKHQRKVEIVIFQS